MQDCLPGHRRISAAALWSAMVLACLVAAPARPQTYVPPTSGDFGAPGPFTVSVHTFTNPVYPTANGETLVVSVYHPGASINPALPTIFFAHGYTSPIGNAANYLNILNHLASRGYNVVFSPYEGGVSPNIGQRFDELITGFEAAVALYSLNTAEVGFSGHSYGGGFLPSVILHEMMGKADAYRPGNVWGGSAAFFYAMAPGFAYSGGGQTDVYSTQSISFPPNLNVIEQAFEDDATIADPRVALDIFYNISTPNTQKAFLTVYGDSHGTNQVVANHFLPNAYNNSDVPLQSWGILRRLDALAAWSFTGDTTAWELALGNGTPAQTYQGVWSDSLPVALLGVTDLPSPAASASNSYVVVNWDSAANPRKKFGLFSGPPVITGVSSSSGRMVVTVSNLVPNHNYIEQQTSTLSPATWSNALNFTSSQAEGSPNSSITLTNSAPSPRQFWRILAP